VAACPKEPCSLKRPGGKHKDVVRGKRIGIPVEFL
jgi:hypothetical protein